MVLAWKLKETLAWKWSGSQKPRSPFGYIKMLTVWELCDIYLPPRSRRRIFLKGFCLRASSIYPKAQKPLPTTMSSNSPFSKLGDEGEPLNYMVCGWISPAISLQVLSSTKQSLFMADVTLSNCGPGTGYPPVKVRELVITEDTWCGSRTPRTLELTLVVILDIGGLSSEKARTFLRLFL